MNPVLRSKEMPFLLAGLFATFAWGVTHLTDRLLEAPLLSYSKELLTNEQVKVLDCTSKEPVTERRPAVRYQLKNLSRAKLFKDVSLTVRPSTMEPTAISGVRLRALPPASATAKESCDSTWAKAVIPQFHPGAEMELTVAAAAPGALILQLENAGTAVSVTASGLRTWLVTSEDTVILLLLLAICAVAGLYVRALWTAPTT